MLLRSLAISALLAAPLCAQQGTKPTQRVPIEAPRETRVLGTIDGIVTDTNLVPLRGAFVSILSTNVRVGTGPNGRFRIEKVPAGQYILIVRRGGYSPTSMAVDVPEGDTLRLAYTLTASPTMLPGVTVTEQSVSLRMLEFEQRRKHGMGEFMSEEEIARRNSVFATELFRKFATINVGPSRNSSLTEYFALSRREGGSLGLQACPMTVYLDQVPMPTPFNLDLLPPPKDIAGIEVYQSTSTPVQYQRALNGCGAILIWKR
jgi:hypothetical protein